jgi:cytochrome c oxidase cbb3-type subunit 3
MQMIASTTFAILACLMLSLAAPAWSQRDETSAGGPIGPPESISNIPIRPGPDTPMPTTPDVKNPYQGDQVAIQEGGRLYQWYNCAGCHAPKGGGGMGPPLSDADWIYGDDSVSIFNSIWEGRPEGMPAWAGRIPRDQVWKIVAFIENMPPKQPAFAPPQNR